MTDKPNAHRARRGWWGLAVVAAMFVAGCADESPQARIRANVDAMVAAVEAKRPADFVAHLTDDFAGEGGRLDRQSMRGFLASQMLGAERITIVLTSVDVQETGTDRATATIGAVVAGGRYFPERGEHIEVVTGWRLENGEWRCFRGDRTDSR